MVGTDSQNGQSRIVNQADAESLVPNRIKGVLVAYFASDSVAAINGTPHHFQFDESVEFSSFFDAGA